MKEIIVGILAGIMGGFFKLGWEVPFPPREAGRITPPDVLLEKLGMTLDSSYVFSGYEIAPGSLIIHFGFSIIVAVAYVLLLKRYTFVGKYGGAVFGIGAYIIFHIIILPLLNLTPSAFNLPLDEHISEFFGHIFWMWSMESVRRALLPNSHTNV